MQFRGSDFLTTGALPFGQTVFYGSGNLLLPIMCRFERMSATRSICCWFPRGPPVILTNHSAATSRGNVSSPREQPVDFMSIIRLQGAPKRLKHDVILYFHTGLRILHRMWLHFP